MRTNLLLFTFIFFLIIFTYNINSSSVTFGDESDASNTTDGIQPPDDAPIGPVGNTGAEYKFDTGFYQKIHDIMFEEPRDGDPGVYDGVRYHDVIMVVSRDDGGE